MPEKPNRHKVSSAGHTEAGGDAAVRPADAQFLKDVIAELREQNKKLGAAVSSKWDAPRILTGLLGLAFTTAIAFQAVNAYNLKTIVDSIEEKKNAFDQKLKELNVAHDEVDAIASDLQHVMEMIGSSVLCLHEGYRDISDGMPPPAEAFARDLSNELKATAKLKLERESRFGGTLTRLQLAVLDMQARALFAMQRYGDVEVIGSELIGLDDRNWSGYHFRGLARLMLKADKALAQKDFDKSLELNARYNPDHVNLFELCLKGHDDLEPAALVQGENHLKDYLRQFSETRKKFHPLATVARVFLCIVRAENNRGIKDECANKPNEDDEYWNKILELCKKQQDKIKRRYDPQLARRLSAVLKKSEKAKRYLGDFLKIVDPDGVK